jgi:hypothetical protein
LKGTITVFFDSSWASNLPVVKNCAVRSALSSVLFPLSFGPMNACSGVSEPFTSRRHATFWIS